MTTHLVIPDQHAHFQHDNNRADWLSRLIIDVQPDVVINIGDAADLPALSSYDKGKRSFNGRTYRADIDAHLDFQDRLWEPVKRRKKRMPYSIFCIGNHEQRIEKALDLSPELQGTIGLSDLNLSEWYDTIIPYNGHTPGVIEVDGILYAHYFTSGSMGRPLSGDYHGSHLINKNHQSATQGHSHALNYAVKPTRNGFIHGLACGVYQDYDSDWAGESNKLWWRGVVLKHNVEDGNYDPQFISIGQLRKIYGS